MLHRITSDLAADPIADLLFVFLGDYIDRGPNSFGVLDRLSTLSSIVPTVFLKGNHEAILIDFLWQPLVLPFWKSMGGYPTLLSYGLVPPLQPTDQDCYSLADALQVAMPDSHRAFFESLQTSHQEGDYLFAHAGINPGRPLDSQTERDLLWIRDAFLKSTRRFDKFVVHGHTPVKDPDVTANRVNIDTGAYATGRLTCLVLEEDTRRFL
ncbi:metallophosphoesterase [Hyphomicrobiales bacterium BP6-180914]|uniref:Metallophosphoesterase n=1 Tax=Lichenifustis flavocetrariae TaxID=2949735 RepID=A0AA41Z1F5_9HYPH|nr:metallophosphoesterase [Lichenifustis flavocetrariae]